CREYSNPKILNNLISGNISTKSGGGILVEVSNPEIIGNVISGNICYKWGGGIEINGSACLVANNIIADNISTGEYGGYGAGIYILGSSYPTLLNNTFYGNTGNKQGGGISCTSGSSAVVKNTIFWNNNAPDGHEIFIDSTASVNLSYSDLQGGQGEISANSGGIVVWGAGMVDLDPGFVDPAHGDFHIFYTSPCLNQGDDAVLVVLTEDIDGNPREAFDAVDIGADEFFKHFYCTESSFPGGEVRASFVGMPGTALVGFWIGSGILDTPLHCMFGNWYLDFPVLDPIVLPPIPADGVETLIANVPILPTVPYMIPMQALIGSELTSYAVINIEP
ncbi:MAG: right-handed parallel beta-helix repeat-containing protein, partial [Planctomycetota bacterium]